MFGLLRNRRRRRVLATAAIPDEIWRKVLVSVPVLDWLDTDEQSRLRALSLLFLHEKRIEAAGGLVVVESMKARVAALACLPILELDLDCYAGFVSVILYPGEFVVRGREHVDEAGVVHIVDDILSGEAWEA